MTSKKCGDFISLLRKKRNLTQKQLAESLNVSDKAISRWETGKGYPDVNSLVALSNFFGVSVNELLAGERIEKEILSDIAEKNVIDAIKSQEEAVKKKKLQMIVVSVILCVLLLPAAIPTFIYFIDTAITMTSFENATEFIGLLTVGFLIVATGFAISKGHISLLHSYHYTNVVDREGYCKAIGKATMLMGVPVVISAITTLFPSIKIIESAGTVILSAGLIIGCAFIFKIQYKYNGGLF